MDSTVTTLRVNRRPKLSTIGDLSTRSAACAGKNIEADEQDQFREVVENELMGLHDGNFVRYLIKPSQFRVWQEAWNKPG